MKKITLILILTYFSLNIYSQVTVYPDNHVRIGWDGGSSPNKHFHVNDNVTFQCLPAACALYFQNYTNQYVPGGGPNNPGSTTFNEPSIVGQWGNSAWLGTYESPFWQVRTFEVWANNILVNSDSTLKSNIKNLDSAMSNLILLNPVTYDHLAGITDDTPEQRKSQIEDAGKNQIGLLAQEVRRIYPNLVHDKGNGELAVDYISLIPILIKAIQEQQRQIDLLEQQLND